MMYNETKAPGTQGTQLVNVTILTKPVEIREGKPFYEAFSKCICTEQNHAKIFRGKNY